MMNIAVFVSGGGTNLQALIDAQNRGEIKNGKITFVLASNDGAYALERAKKAGIPTAVVSRKSYSSKECLLIALFKPILIASKIVVFPALFSPIKTVKSSNETLHSFILLKFFIYTSFKNILPLSNPFLLNILFTPPAYIS